MIFDGVKNGEMLDFGGFCRTHYRTRKWGFRRENIRYAVPGNRLLALKCKQNYSNKNIQNEKEITL